MLLCACTARCDNRNRNIIGNKPCKLDIVAILCAVTIHACKKDFSRSKLICLNSPLNGIKTCIYASSVLVYIPAASISTTSCINCHNHTLTAKLVSRITYKPRGIYST